ESRKLSAADKPTRRARQALRPWSAPTYVEMTRAEAEQISVTPGANRCPSGGRAARAAWLRRQLDDRLLTVDEVARQLGLEPEDIKAIVAGRDELAVTQWKRLARLTEGRLQ